MTVFTYIIKSTVDDRYFYGQTTNLLRRLNQHNRGLEEATKAGRPWVLVAYREFETRGGAMSYERRLRALKNIAEVENFIREHHFHLV
ncbi:MAG: GIY-YIG nuclease family protein [Bacteroidales bacterium]|nr:GIY-YIG nuclease family protein [Bacteroidales bacterium]